VAQSTGDKWLSVQQAADELEVGRRQVYNLINRGELAGYKVGRVVRIKRVDFETWLEAQMIEPGELDHLMEPKDRVGTKEPKATIRQRRRGQGPGGD
jgi:excisionase family DNA binding protein